MSARPPVSVVVPFAGTVAQADAALAGLGALLASDGDERILVDNSGTVRVSGLPDGVRVVRADRERSPAAARNAGAAVARGTWLLFLDADVSFAPGLLGAFFGEPIAGEVGALAGAITGDSGGRSLAARYGTAKSFLDSGRHLAHPFLPRAAAANLLVRREAFVAVGGFLEGLRAAEDTDLCWRLQRAGWSLAAAPVDAVVVHRYRSSVAGLRRQWRGYAAGRAWLGRRYDGFSPEPALARVVRRGRLRPDPAAGNLFRPQPDKPSQHPRGDGDVPAELRGSARVERLAFAALDVVLGLEELVGFALSNRPSADASPPSATTVIVTGRFSPVEGRPFALTGPARIEAAARADSARVPPGSASVVYHEDDGAAARAFAFAWLIARHPLRALCHRGPGLAALAPAVRRLRGDAPGVVVAPLQAGDDPAARRLAALAGRRGGAA